jgi:hypothetical protein
VSDKQTPKIGEGKPGPGRPKGLPNKTTALLKDAILQAATKAGGGDLVEYLTGQAAANPGPFMALLGKVLPLQIAGDSENPIAIQMVELRAVYPKNDAGG